MPHFVEILGTYLMLRWLESLAVRLYERARRIEVEVELAHVGDRVSEKTREKLASQPVREAASRREGVTDPRFLRGGAPERRRA